MAKDSAQQNTRKKCKTEKNAVHTRVRENPRNQDSGWGGPENVNRKIGRRRRQVGDRMLKSHLRFRKGQQDQGKKMTWKRGGDQNSTGGLLEGKGSRGKLKNTE